ncbi:alpha/beta hydrolase [Candidatus Woesearchaeota archaeon]|nr:alpha/beta hydrolase [Candidatus Woesearchaeota archaeon]
MNIIPTIIPSTKGNLASVIHFPKKQTDKLAILCPGYLDSKDYTHLVSLAELLCTQGFTVVRFDPAGTWESEGVISDYTTSQYLKNIKNVLEYMLTKANFNLILLGGHSRGGEVSILYAVGDTRINVVLGIMPSHGLVTGQKRNTWKEAGVSVSQRDLPNDKTKKIEFRVPFHYVLDRERYDALEDVKKIKVPLILIAGELDDIVPPKMVKELFDNANSPKEFFVIPNIGHDYRHNMKEIMLINKIILEKILVILKRSLKKSNFGE